MSAGLSVSRLKDQVQKWSMLKVTLSVCRWPELNWPRSLFLVFGLMKARLPLPWAIVCQGVSVSCKHTIDLLSRFTQRKQRASGSHLEKDCVVVTESPLMMRRKCLSWPWSWVEMCCILNVTPARSDLKNYINCILIFIILCTEAVECVLIFYSPFCQQGFTLRCSLSTCRNNMQCPPRLIITLNLHLTSFI